MTIENIVQKWYDNTLLLTDPNEYADVLSREGKLALWQQVSMWDQCYDALTERLSAEEQESVLYGLSGLICQSRGYDAAVVPALADELQSKSGAHEWSVGLVEPLSFSEYSDGLVARLETYDMIPTVDEQDMASKRMMFELNSDDMERVGSVYEAMIRLEDAGYSAFVVNSEAYAALGSEYPAYKAAHSPAELVDVYEIAPESALHDPVIPRMDNWKNYSRFYHQRYTGYDLDELGRADHDMFIKQVMDDHEYLENRVIGEDVHPEDVLASVYEKVAWADGLYMTGRMDPVRLSGREQMALQTLGRDVDRVLGRKSWETGASLENPFSVTSALCELDAFSNREYHYEQKYRKQVQDLYDYIRMDVGDRTTSPAGVKSLADELKLFGELSDMGCLYEPGCQPVLQDSDLLYDNLWDQLDQEVCDTVSRLDGDFGTNSLFVYGIAAIDFASVERVCDEVLLPIADAMNCEAVSLDDGYRGMPSYMDGNPYGMPEEYDDDDVFDID